MKNILSEIIAKKRLEIASLKELKPLKILESEIENKENLYSLKKSLELSQTGIIAEFKRRSPSKGWIFESAKLAEIVPAYVKNGASAVSVLTDCDFFGGSSSDLKEARTLVRAPLLRKDFTVDEYQIFEAKLFGANAILLIASALSIEDAKNFARLAKDLNLDVLLEIHNERELAHINEFVDIVGINNRDLNTFETKVKTSFDLGGKIPSDFLKISESGISNADIVKELRQAGFKGFLMGEAFMKTEDPAAALSNFINGLL